jgi:iron complex outermembrane receptor protein
MCPPGWPLTQALLLPGVTPSLDNQVYSSPVTSSGARIHDTDVALTIDYHIGDFTLSSTTAYQHEYQQNTQDLFAVGAFFFDVLTGGHLHFNNTQTQTEWIDTTTEEIKLVSPANRPLNFVVGGFFNDNKVHETYFRALAPAGVNYDVTPDTKTYDLYGRGTLKILNNTSVTAGLRYNRDVLNYINFQTQFVQAAPPSCQVHPVTTPPTFIPCFSAGSDTSSALVGDITVQQKFGAASMAYFTYARGYAPKAYNTSLALTNDNPPNIPSRTGPGGVSFAPGDVLAAVGQEHINNFELGLKGSYFDRRLTLNAAAFYTLYDNYQIQIFSAQAGVINPLLLLESTGKAETRGIEIDSVLQPTDHLTIGFDAAYVDAKFTKYPDAPCWVGQTAAEGCIAGGGPNGSNVQDASGKTMPNSPKFKFNLNIAQVIPLDSAPFDITLAGNYTYRTSAQMLADQNPESVQPGFGVLNLSAGITSKDHHYSATVFVDNVFDKHYFVDMEDFFSGPWASNAVIGQPARDASRYAGLRLEAKF